MYGMDQWKGVLGLGTDISAGVHSTGEDHSLGSVWFGSTALISFQHVWEAFSFVLLFFLFELVDTRAIDGNAFFSFLLARKRPPLIGSDVLSLQHTPATRTRR